MAVEMEDIREGLATNLRTLEDVKQVSAYRLDNPTPPTLMVIGFDEIEPTTFGRGGFSIPMLIQGIAGTSTAKGAQVKLDKWLSPMGDENVWSAIESDPTLGGKVDDLTVTLCEGAQLISLEGGTFVLGSTWHVQIEI